MTIDAEPTEVRARCYVGLKKVTFCARAVVIAVIDNGSTYALAC